MSTPFKKTLEGLLLKLLSNPTAYTDERKTESPKTKSIFHTVKPKCEASNSDILYLIFNPGNVDALCFGIGTPDGPKQRLWADRERRA